MSSPVKQFTTPHMIRGTLQDGEVALLEKIVFSAKERSDGSPLYDEDWIQNLIFKYPNLLPVQDLEPAFFPFYPVCRELRTPAGPLDNLFVSENGGLVLVECKLWRNPESRREVIGQALDYAKEFSRWSYEDLVDAVRDTTKLQGDGIQEAVRQGNEDLDEAAFIDAVSKNLKRGRFLVLIVGDGIREGVEDITKFLQRHVGLDFTFGLVELSVFKVMGKDEYFVQPRILANSCTIERAVIRVDEKGVVSVSQPVAESKGVGARPAKRTTISEEQFYEELTASTNPTVANDLRQFADRLSKIGVVPAFGSSSLNLRWLPESTQKMNFGSIRKVGTVDTDPANWVPTRLSRPDIGERYQDALATIVGGSVLKAKNGTGFTLRVVRGDGAVVTLADLLTRKDQWFDLIGKTQDELIKAVRQLDNE